MNRNEIIEMLSIPEESNEWEGIIKQSYEYCRKTFNNKGYIFAQIGLNNAPCSGGCGFCSLAVGSGIFCEEKEKSESEVLALCKDMTDVSDLFLMSTADYSFNKFIKISGAVKRELKASKRFVANIGDFEYERAQQLKDIGFTGVYHIKRLREGIDTALSPVRHEKTINAAIKAGLDIYYCVEPIGKEHGASEIADIIEYACGLGVKMMAVMRRVEVKGTPLYGRGEISEKRLTQIAAVTALSVKPTVSMNAHEPCEISLSAGVNQLYAEFGLNPRDTAAETGKSRGMAIEDAKKMLLKHKLIL